MSSFLQGLGQALQAAKPDIDRYIMLEEGYDPRTVELTLAERENQRRTQQAEQQRQSLAQMIMDKGDSLTPQELMYIGSQNPELGNFAASIWRSQQENKLKQQELDMQGTQDIIPFSGTSMDAQAANLAYLEGLNQGLDDFSARKYAVDKIRTSRSDLRINPETGMLDSVPRQPIFGGAKPIYKTSDTGGDEQSDFIDEPMAIDDTMLIPAQRAEKHMGKDLGDALYDSSGIVPVLQRNARAVAQPIDELMARLGFNTDIAGKVGGDGLEGAAVTKYGWLDDTLRSMMSTRAQGELKQLEKKYNIDSLSPEGAKEKTKAILGVLKNDVTKLQSQIENTVNAQQRNKLIAEKLTPLQYVIAQGEGALRQMGVREQQSNAQRRLKYNPNTGSLE